MKNYDYFENVFFFLIPAETSYTVLLPNLHLFFFLAEPFGHKKLDNEFNFIMNYISQDD